MTNDEIIAAMVKGREYCRQIVQLYESVHGTGDATNDSLAARRNTLAKANSALTQMLLQMKSLPDKPASHFAEKEDRQYITSLFAEISDLLEKAMILEREVRSSVRASEGSQGQSHGSRAMKAYGV